MGPNEPQFEPPSAGQFGKLVLLALLVLLIIVVLVVSIGSLNRAYNRYQAVADARNEIQVNRMVIEQTEQLVEIEKQKAQVRIQEAHGISESQAIIDASLTPYYLQYLAIQAQMDMAQQPNHSSIFLPIQEGGMPFVYGLDGHDTSERIREQSDN